MGLKIRYSALAEIQKEEWKKSGDKKSMAKIELLMKDILQTAFAGLGKPEPLKHNLSGMWSRQINKKDRLVYQIEENTLMIISIKGHYEDK